MAKKGYVSRVTIEDAIAVELSKKGVSHIDAKARARSYISSFKKEIPASTRSKIILNEGNREQEQYRCQDLGEWLYKRRGLLKEFRTLACPCNIHFDLSISEGISIADGRIALDKDIASDPKALIQEMLLQTISHEKEKVELNKRLAEYEEKEAKTKEKQRAAGLAGGRGRSKW